MTRPANAHDTLVYRLSQVLQKLNQGESLDPQQLADEFGVNLRTIQRDLNVRHPDPGGIINGTKAWHGFGICRADFSRPVLGIRRTAFALAD